MRSPWAYRLLMMLAVVGHFLLAYQLQRNQTIAVLATFAMLWALFFIQWKWQQWRAGQIIAYGMLLRSVYLVSMPVLSDDVFRYIWDGHLSLIGTSPFAELPAEFMRQARPEVFQQLFPLINSPNYYSIYPPFMQVLFAMAAKVGGTSILGSVVVLRLLVLLAEFGTLWLIHSLLRVWKLPLSGLVLYALNPLVIAEFSGNLHTEAFMVFFLLVSVWLLTSRTSGMTESDSNVELVQHRSTSSPSREGQRSMVASSPSFWGGVGGGVIAAVVFGLAIAVKLLPLMLLPFFITALGWRKAMVFGVVAVLTAMVTFVPFFTLQMLGNMASSAKLYFATFEFNASIYYVIREVGFWVKGYNIIATTAEWLPRIVFVGIVALALFHRQRKVRRLPALFIFALSIYYAMANTVHPWYVVSMAAFLPFVSIRFPLVWMVLLPLSYHAYASTQYQEQLWMVALEYLPVYGWVLYEWISDKWNGAPTADAHQ